MKTKLLFLLDGVYGDAKRALCQIVYERTLGDWVLLKKDTTKDKNKILEDMRFIEKEKAEKLYKIYDDANEEERLNLEYFCYEYPKIYGFSSCDVINCIEVKQIDDFISGNKDVALLVVRNERCSHDIIKKYRNDKRIRVVPIFVYTDFSYIDTDEKLSVEKWKKLFDGYTTNQPQIEFSTEYEHVIIFRGENYTSATASFKQQIIKLIEQVNRNFREKIVSRMPERIRGFNNQYADVVISEMENNDYGKRVFIMMKFHGAVANDKFYEPVQKTFEKTGKVCVRADDTFVEDKFASAQPDQRYWLATYLCKYGLAIFEKDEKDNLILNPNVIYEMGIMKQQGKKVFILVPEGVKTNGVNMFFDINNEWKYKYENIEDITNAIDKIAKEIEQNS